MAAAHSSDCTASNPPVLYLALDLGINNWKLAFTVGLGQKPRLRTIPARSTLSLVLEIRAAKKQFGLSEDALVLRGRTRRFLAPSLPAVVPQDLGTV